MRGTLLAFATCGILLVTGCSTNVGYSVLDRSYSEADALPEVVLEQSEGVDSSTSRFIGVDDGVSFWLTRSIGRDGVCLIGYPNDQDWVTSCGGAGSKLAFKGRLGTYELYPDHTPKPEGAKQVFKNIVLVAE